MSESAKTWSFSAPIERFEMDGTMHFLCIPESIEDEVRACPEKRYVITVNDVATWHCGLLGTGDGRWVVMVSRDDPRRMGSRRFGRGSEQIRHGCAA